MALLAQNGFGAANSRREPEVEGIRGREDLAEAESLLMGLASVFASPVGSGVNGSTQGIDAVGPSNAEAKYRALLEQIPAVVFMAHVDGGVSEAYVSPEIEAALGYSREEWLEDPVRWYERIHPEDKQRWSLEAAEMFLTGKPLRSAYRVIARDGHVVWFHCDARMMRRPDGQPWFIHGVAFDISDLKRTESALQLERNFVSTILETVGALVIVLDGEGRIVRFNRACELTSGYTFAEVSGKPLWDFFQTQEEAATAKRVVEQLGADAKSHEFQSRWVTRQGDNRLIAWSSSRLPEGDGMPAYIIATGIDITEREQLEKALLNISAREQRRIGQDLHDELGQHLTGIAFMAKVHEEKLAGMNRPEAADAAKIVRLVNDAVHKTRELARGLLPVMSDAQGLMSALQLWAEEVEDIFGISCKFECESKVLIHDTAVATHLYHIAQEAVNNALKHGRAQNIVLRLLMQDGHGILMIADDGTGIPEDRQKSQGMGLHIMNYRAGMIGGQLDVTRNPARGTIVSCTFKMGPENA